MRFPDARIIVFAKAPIPGHSKTRLIPALGEVGASELHTRLVRHTLVTATQAKLCPVELHCADNLHHPFFTRCQQDFSVTLKRQRGADLGARMANAFDLSLSTSRHVILIGSDCPALTSADLQQALETIMTNQDCVLKPAEDGGYVLIGLKALSHYIFSEIDWGTNRVLKQTQAKLLAVNWHWQELDTTWDLDRPEDLTKLHGIELSAIK